MTMKFTGAVLTGGASRRMGVDKALIEIDGAPLVARSVTALRDAGAGEVIALGGDAFALVSVGGVDRVVADLHPGEGPLGGLLTAFESAGSDVVVVLACDVPGITSADVLQLVTALDADPTADVAHAVVGGRAQPLTAAWRIASTSPIAADAFGRGVRAPRELFGELRCIEVDTLPRTAVDDIDSIEDLHRYASTPLGVEEDEPE